MLNPAQHFTWCTLHQFSSVQSLSHVKFFATPWTAACQASLSNTNSRSLLKLMSIELVIPSNHLILCHLLLPIPSIFPSIEVFTLIYLSLTALGLHYWAWTSSSCSEWGLSLQRLLLLRFMGSVVVMHWLSCSMLCGIFLDQGSNPRPLHWQADSFIPLGTSHFSHFQFPWKAWRSFLGTDLLHWPLHQST